MNSEHGVRGQLFDQTIKQFLGELEKTQWKIIRSKIEQESRLIREQILEERRIILELTGLIAREREIIARMGEALDRQGRAIDSISSGGAPGREGPDTG